MVAIVIRSSRSFLHAWTSLIREAGKFTHMYGSLFEDLKYTWSPFVNIETSTRVHFKSVQDYLIDTIWNLLITQLHLQEVHCTEDG